MKVTLARNCGNGVVEHIIFGDPYQAFNFCQSYCGRVAAVVKCESIYTIGSGEHAERNCFNCPLCHICVCENYNLTDVDGKNYTTKVTDFTKFD